MTDEKEKIEKYLAAATNKNGNPRFFKDELDKTQDKISKAIRRVMKKISKLNMDLFKHLQLSIELGSVYSYQPSEKIIWES